MEIILIVVLFICFFFIGTILDNIRMELKYKNALTEIQNKILESKLK